MVKWISFWIILLVKVLGTDVFDDLDLDYKDPIKMDMEPKTNEDEMKPKINTETENPQSVVLKTREKVKGTKDINCIDFSKYATNCTVGAALLYNSPRVTPPMPNKIRDWCKSIRHLTTCAMDWNTECNESTDNLFNEDSIKGHMHVMDNICNDEWFLTRYNEAAACVETAADKWEDCYSTFKLIVEEQKNLTREWTHFETHFYLCCAQAQFRRCTLDFLFELPKCPYEQAVTMQKFSVIISQGDVFQDCDGKILYANCPNGDPLPTQQQLKMLMEGGANDDSNGTKRHLLNIFILISSQSLLVKFYLYCRL